MTAREYLAMRGLIVEENGQQVLRWHRQQEGATFIVRAPLGWFLNTFGRVIEQALAQGRSVYDALMHSTFEVQMQVEGPDGQPTTINVQRTALELGWAGHFGSWRADGLID